MAAESRVALARMAATLARAWTRARAMGFFACEGPGLRLEVSDCLDQAALDHVTALWTELPLPLPLQHGTPYFASVDERIASVIVPCLVAGRVSGLLYLEQPSAGELSVTHLHVLGSLLGALLDPNTAEAAAWQPDARGAADEPEASNLVALLERYDWNVSRVARALGVTRMTVYNRMRRLGVPRPQRRGRVSAA